MAEKRPLAIYDGEIEVLRAGDTLPGGGGGGGAVVNQVDLNFGSSPVYSASFSFSMTASVGQNVIMTPSAEADGDELDMDNFLCAARVSVANTVDAFVTAFPGPVIGTRRFNVLIG